MMCWSGAPFGHFGVPNGRDLNPLCVIDDILTASSNNHVMYVRYGSRIIVFRHKGSYLDVFGRPKAVIRHDIT